MTSNAAHRPYSTRSGRIVQPTNKMLAHMNQQYQGIKANRDSFDPPRAVALPPTALPRGHTTSQPSRVKTTITPSSCTGDYRTNSHISNEEADELEQMPLEEISKTELGISLCEEEIKRNSRTLSLSDMSTHQKVPYMSQSAEMNRYHVDANAAEGHGSGPRYRSTSAERTHNVHAGNHEQPMNQEPPVMQR